MEVPEAAEQVRALADLQAAEHAHETRFRNRVAVMIAVMAVLLAVTAIFAQKSSEHELNANVDVADIRSTHDSRVTQLQEDRDTIQADQEQLADPALPPEVRNLVQEHLQADETLAARLQSNPSLGDGIEDLEAQLHTVEREQETSAARNDSFDLGATLFEIAIVLASVGVLIVSFRLSLLAGVAGVLALLLLLNGLMLLVRL